MLSGYWPVVGTAVALATADGRVAVVAPKDEEDLARESAADVYPFEPGSLHELRTVREAIRGPSADAPGRTGIGRGRVGHDAGAAFEPSPYAALHSYGRDLPALLTAALPGIARDRCDRRPAVAAGGADAVRAVPRSGSVCARGRGVRRGAARVCASA